MRKTLVKNRFFLILLCAITVGMIFLFMDENSRIDNTSNHQIDLMAVDYDKEYFINFKTKTNQQHVVENIGDTEIDDEAHNENTHPLDTMDSEQSIQNLQRYLSSFSSELLMAIDLQEKFDADEMDYVLVNEAEKNIAYIFYQGMAWQEFSPQDINCKANICRVQLTITDDEKNTKLMELISNEMKSESIHHSFAIPVRLPAENIGYVYFVKGSLIGVLPGNS